MSHLTTIKTELRNLTMVQAALRRLQISFELGRSVQDMAGRTQAVDIVVQFQGQRAVGFRQDTSTGIIELVGDWWGGSLKEQEFLDKLKCNYAREQVLESLEQQGIDLSKVREIEEPDGSVVFELPLDDQEMEALATGR